VLQSNSIKFTPVLARTKTDAINRLGMGVMDKLWLEFPTAFWTNDLTNDWITYVSDTPGQWALALNAYKYINKPVLLMFNIG
jgi:monoamine oxidase